MTGPLSAPVARLSMPRCRARIQAPLLVLPIPSSSWGQEVVHPADHAPPAPQNGPPQAPVTARFTAFRLGTTEPRSRSHHPRRKLPTRYPSLLPPTAGGVVYPCGRFAIGRPVAGVTDRSAVTATFAGESIAVVNVIFRCTSGITPVTNPHHPGLPLHPICSQKSTNVRGPRRYAKPDAPSASISTCRNALLMSVI